MKQTFSLGDVAAAVRTPPDLLASWVKLGHVPLADPKAFTRNEVAYASVVAQLVRSGFGRLDAEQRLTEAAAAAIRDAVDDQPEYWRFAIDMAISGCEANLFFKRYTYNGVETFEGQLFVPAPMTDTEDAKKWISPAIDLGAQRAAFAHGERTGQFMDAEQIDTTEALDDDPVIYQIDSTIRAAVKALPWATA